MSRTFHRIILLSLVVIVFSCSGYLKGNSSSYKVVSPLANYPVRGVASEQGQIHSCSYFLGSESVRLFKDFNLDKKSLSVGYELTVTDQLIRKNKSEVRDNQLGDLVSFTKGPERVLPDSEGNIPLRYKIFFYTSEQNLLLEKNASLNLFKEQGKWRPLMGSNQYSDLFDDYLLLTVFNKKLAFQKKLFRTCEQEKISQLRREMKERQTRDKATQEYWKKVTDLKILSMNLNISDRPLNEMGNLQDITKSKIDYLPTIATEKLAKEWFNSDNGPLRVKEISKVIESILDKSKGEAEVLFLQGVYSTAAKSELKRLAKKYFYRYFDGSKNNKSNNFGLVTLVRKNLLPRKKVDILLHPFRYENKEMNYWFKSTLKRETGALVLKLRMHGLGETLLINKSFLPFESFSDQKLWQVSQFKKKLKKLQKRNQKIVMSGDFGFALKTSSQVTNLSSVERQELLTYIHMYQKFYFIDSGLASERSEAGLADHDRGFVWVALANKNKSFVINKFDRLSFTGQDNYSAIYSHILFEK